MIPVDVRKPIFYELCTKVQGHYLVLLNALILCLFYIPYSVFAQELEVIPTYSMIRPIEKKQIEFDFTRYDAKTYEIAYKVYLMNNKAYAAFEVAKAAVHFNPQNILWRKRLAQSGLWSGHMDYALHQWLYLFNNGIEKSVYAQKILELAAQLHDYNTQIQIIVYLLTRRPYDHNLQLKYIIALQGAGFPLKALNYLDTLPYSKNEIPFIQQYIAIAQGINNLSMLHKYLKLWQTKEPKALEPLFREASLYLSEGKLDRAWTLYQRIIKLHPKQDGEFWHRYAELALLMGNNGAMIIAYNAALHEQSISASDILNLVNLEYLKGSNKQAFNHAVKGFRQNQSANLFTLIMSLGETTKQWSTMLATYENLPPNLQKEYMKDLNNRIILTDVYQHMGLIDRANALWETILSLHSKSTRVRVAYLWFLIDTHQYSILPYYLYSWGNNSPHAHPLWRVMSVGLSSLGQKKTALAISLSQLPYILKHEAEALDLSDLFQDINQTYLAYLVRIKALADFNRHSLLQPISMADSSQLIMLGRLAQYFSSASTLYTIFYSLQKLLIAQNEVNDAMISWSLETKADSLTRLLIKEIEMRHKYVPDWMRLSLALKENDLTTLQSVLSQAKVPLPTPDVVEAATRLGQYKQAEQAAYDGLVRHPNDNDSLVVFRDTLLDRANKLSLDADYYSFSPVSGPQNIFNLRYFVTPLSVISLINRIWFPKTQDETQLSNPPKLVRGTGIKIKRVINKGFIQITGEERQGLKHYGMAGLSLHRILSQRMETELKLNYHELSDETAPMVLGGMKNTAAANLFYTWDSYQSFSGEADYWEFLGQNQQVFGHGTGLSIDWIYQFVQSDPDWNLLCYWDLRNYYSKEQILLPPLQSIVPFGVVPTTVFYMPSSYREIGIIIGFGQKYRDLYTHHWRPFGTIGISQSNAFGMGKILSAGYTGSIFGRDKLLLYFDYADNTKQSQQNVYTLGAKYDYYFN